MLAYIDTQGDYVPADALQEMEGGRSSPPRRRGSTFKESDCDAVEYEWWGGSGAGIAETTCLYSHTAQRVEDLKSRYLDR